MAEGSAQPPSLTDHDNPPNTAVSDTEKLGFSISDSRSGLVKRAMERVDILSRSKSVGSKSLSQSQPALPLQGHRRLFSLSNRGKGKTGRSSKGN
ncbi:hypothetical protein A0H81_00471 [Grifola frondosa]|uniref:Uncharacterized protein n=1 Tax=Grifola frondosa TaxID=5627 RepID=A0A1C7MQC5_GRIFR|nr:hypothetical protein A0H81_00471 [Grifola frondosa]